MTSAHSHLAVLARVLITAGALLASGTLARSKELNNARVVEMTKLGLGDDIIIAKIRSDPERFHLGDQDLLKLKAAGVSDTVIATMLETAVVRTARVFLDGKPLELTSTDERRVPDLRGRLGGQRERHPGQGVRLRSPLRRRERNASRPSKHQCPRRAAERRLHD